MDTVECLSKYVYLSSVYFKDMLQGIRISSVTIQTEASYQNAPIQFARVYIQCVCVH